MAPTSKMLQLTLSIDALFEPFRQSANKQVKYFSHEVTLHHPNSLTKTMDACLNVMEITPDSLVHLINKWGHL